VSKLAVVDRVAYIQGLLWSLKGQTRGHLTKISDCKVADGSTSKYVCYTGLADAMKM
jgi:hypothetical protein